MTTTSRTFDTTGWYLLSVNQDKTCLEALTYWNMAASDVGSFLNTGLRYGVYELTEEYISTDHVLTEDDWGGIDITDTSDEIKIFAAYAYWVYYVSSVINGTVLKYNSTTGILGLVSGSVFTGKITSDDETAELKAELDTAFPNTTFVVVDDSTTDYTFANWRFLLSSDDDDIVGNTYQLITTHVTNMAYSYGYGSDSGLGLGGGLGSFGLSFNEDISSWDTSSVTDMMGMFHNQYVFNQDISNWDTSSVTSMEYCLDSNPVFNQDLSKWNVSKVTTFNQMFSSATVFNQDLSNWDVSSSTTFLKMFYYANAFNQVLTWDIPDGAIITDMFTNSSGSVG